MSDSNRFGRIVSALQVEQAVVASLSQWMDDYLGEAERLFGYQPNAIERPRGIVNSSEWEKWPEDQIPVILVLNAGLSGQPIRRASGVYDAAWLVGISPIVSDVDQASTRTLALAYTTAIRAAVLQHKMLKSSLYPDGFANFTSWQDETYSDVPFLSSRSMMAGRVILEIGVEGVLTEQTGPRTPTPAPATDPGPWLPVTQVPAVTTVPKNPTEAVQ